MKTERLEAELASERQKREAAEAILRRAIEWWLREGREQFDGAPEWVFAVRTLLGIWGAV